jgi:hypothetical protein
MVCFCAKFDYEITRVLAGAIEAHFHNTSGGLCQVLLATFESTAAAAAAAAAAAV